AGKGDVGGGHARQRRGRSGGGGELPIAREQLAAGFHLGAGERGGGGQRRHLRAAHDDEPLTPGSLFFLKSPFRPSHRDLRFSHSSILPPSFSLLTSSSPPQTTFFPPP